jgi:hypothetical protein
MNKVLITVAFGIGAVFVTGSAALAGSANRSDTRAAQPFKLYADQSLAATEFRNDDAARVSKRISLHASVAHQIAEARQKLNGITAVHYVVPGAGAFGI